jgi:hypothetical protein
MQQGSSSGMCRCMHTPLDACAGRCVHAPLRGKKGRGSTSRIEVGRPPPSQ